MAVKDYLKTHRTWEDGLGLFFGMAIGLSPYMTAEVSNISAVLNAAFAGLAILLIAQLELVHLRRWEEGLELMLGIWVGVSPFVFGYAGSGSLRFVHWGLGASVALLGGLELWQDWRKSREELDRYGS
jgi:SPW repeat